VVSWLLRLERVLEGFLGVFKKEEVKAIEVVFSFL